MDLCWDFRYYFESGIRRKTRVGLAWGRMAILQRSASLLLFDSESDIVWLWLLAYIYVGFLNGGKINERERKVISSIFLRENYIFCWKIKENYCNRLIFSLLYIFCLLFWIKILRKPSKKKIKFFFVLRMLPHKKITEIIHFLFFLLIYFVLYFIYWCGAKAVFFFYFSFCSLEHNNRKLPLNKKNNKERVLQTPWFVTQID